MRNPIGIFDSGIGGLTVVKELIKLLPDEHLIYFGDTARIPYGTKSKRLIEQYALEDANFLLQYDIKLLVVACNTASSLALPVLEEKLKIPVVGVVKPGARAAVKMSKNKRIGVVGTSATINSSSYGKEISLILKDAQVFGQPCPLLVQLVEEGWLDDEITMLTLKKYLEPILIEKIDTLILGCTHYPLLEKAIRQVAGPGVNLIDSGRETAKAVKELLNGLNILNNSGRFGANRYYVSDIPAKFEEIGSRFLGQPLKNVERVEFEKFLIQSGMNMAHTKMYGA
ncbi:MAG: glutamate racemase [Calditrichaceae bacterium]